MEYFTMVEENLEIHHLKWLKMTWNRSKRMDYFTMVEESFEIHHLKWLKITWYRFTCVSKNVIRFLFFGKTVIRRKMDQKIFLYYQLLHLIEKKGTKSSTVVTIWCCYATILQMSIWLGEEVAPFLATREPGDQFLSKTIKNSNTNVRRLFFSPK